MKNDYDFAIPLIIGFLSTLLVIFIFNHALDIANQAEIRSQPPIPIESIGDIFDGNI